MLQMRGKILPSFNVTSCAGLVARWRFLLKRYLVPGMELCGYYFDEVAGKGEAMGSMELFLLGVMAGWIPPLIIVVVLACQARSMDG
jgi:hypothetical protein